MDANVENVLKKTAAYIEVAQSEIDRNNEKRIAFLKRADEVAAKLASKGIIPGDSVSAFRDKVAANETEVWSLVEKLADAIPIDDMGSPARDVQVKGANMSPWDRMFHYGSSRATASGTELQ